MVDSQTSSSSCPARVSYLNYCVNAAPCRMLAWGKSLLNVKSCVSPTGPDHSKNRETVFLDHCHRTGPVSGGRRDRNVCQTSNLYWLEALHQLMDKEWCSQSSQFKISGLLQPFLVPKPHNHWRPILGLSKPNLSETIRTTLQQWEWVTSIDFKEAYFHIPIQEQSRTYQISCPGSDIPVQSTVFRSVHCTHGAHCSSKGVETDSHTQGYNNPPVLRRLVGESHIPPGLSPAYTRSSENMPSFRLAGEFKEKKIETGTKSRSSTL